MTDVPYLRVFQRETTPAWLCTTAMLLGFQAPDMSRPFRYADLGAGNGLTCAIVAAAHPQAEVWGFDFNPTHIMIARRLAKSAGLDNLRFVETSFADLANRPDADLPRFDFMVSHGVLSWISPENQKLVYSIFAQRLESGGLAYLGYNAMAGWSSMLPIRDLMRLLGEGGGKRSDTAMADILQFIERLKAGGARYFDVHPTVQQRLDHLQAADPRYLAHEFLTENWRPLSFAEVADAMAEAKCSFIGSATLTDNIDAVSVPPGVAPMLAETKDVRVRETLRDLAAGTSLRRDIFCRGSVQLTSAEQTRLATELAFISLGAPAEAEITFTLPAGEVIGRPEVYGPLLEALGKGPVTVGEAQRLGGSGERSLIETIQAFIMLVAGGQAAPLADAATARAAARACRALNLAIGEANSTGDDIAWLAAPAFSSAIPSDWIETIVVKAMLSGSAGDVESLAPIVMAAMQAAGRAPRREGELVSDSEQAALMVREVIERELDQRAPMLASLGVLEEQALMTHRLGPARRDTVGESQTAKREVGRR